jgi:hypothetical protein
MLSSTFEGGKKEEPKRPDEMGAWSQRTKPVSIVEQVRRVMA